MGIVHEILTYISVYICKVGMPPSHPLIFAFDPLEWVNYYKCHAVSSPEIKNQQGRKFDETCCVRISMCKESKNWKIKDEKDSDKQKKQDS